MANAIATFSGANLPALTSIASSLKKLETEVGQSGNIILKCDKTGTWVYGADQTEVQEGSLWAVNPFSFTHGYIAWGEGDVLGQMMAPITEPLPELTTPPPGAKKGWEQQIGCMLHCTNGEDEGTDVVYATTSVGGKRAVQALALAIAAQVEKDQTKPVPLVELHTDHYQHRQFGKIYTPIFKISEWVSMDGAAPVADTPAPVAAPAAPAAPAEPVRRRRRAAA